MRSSLQLLAIVFACLTGAEGLQAEDARDVRPKLLGDYGFSYLEPVGPGWTCEEPAWASSSRVINYIKRHGPKKELSILIEPHVGADVTDPELQEKFIDMIVHDSEPVHCDITTDLGVPTFVVDYARERTGARVVHVRGFVAFRNGYAYRIVVSTYETTVVDDAEISELAAALRIGAITSKEPESPEILPPPMS